MVFEVWDFIAKFYFKIFLQRVLYGHWEIFTSKYNDSMYLFYILKLFSLRSPFFFSFFNSECEFFSQIRLCVCVCLCHKLKFRKFLADIGKYLSRPWQNLIILIIPRYLLLILFLKKKRHFCPNFFLFSKRIIFFLL